MGTPGIPPVPPGEDCEVCWGPDKPFGAGPPPKYIIAIFHNVKPNEYSCAVHNKKPIPSIPPEIAILMEQLDGYPCQYTNNRFLEEYGWGGHVDFSLSQVLLRRKRDGFNCLEEPEVFYDFLFFDVSQPPCSVYFDKNQYPQWDREGYDGSCNVYF